MTNEITTTTLRNDLKRAIANLEQFDADTAQLWRNVSTFSNCMSNPFRGDAAAAYERKAQIIQQIYDAAENAYFGGVRPTTIARICDGHIRRFNLSIFTS
jgi:hypothetical protein